MGGLIIYTKDHSTSVIQLQNKHLQFFHVNATEVLRNQIVEIIDFILDYHNIKKIKVSIFISLHFHWSIQWQFWKIWILINKIICLNSLFQFQKHVIDHSLEINYHTMGSTIKYGLSQYLALELSKNSGRGLRPFSRYLPWLNNTSIMPQQG